MASTLPIAPLRHNLKIDQIPLLKSEKRTENHSTPNELFIFTITKFIQKKYYPSFPKTQYRNDNPVRNILFIRIRGKIKENIKHICREENEKSSTFYHHDDNVIKV